MKHSDSPNFDWKFNQIICTHPLESRTGQINMVFFRWEHVFKRSQLENLRSCTSLTFSSRPALLCVVILLHNAVEVSHGSLKDSYSAKISIVSTATSNQQCTTRACWEKWRGAAGRVGRTGRRPGYQTFYITSSTSENQQSEGCMKEKSDTHKDVQRSGGNSDISARRRHVCGFRRRAERIHWATSSKGEKAHVIQAVLNSFCRILRSHVSCKTCHLHKSVTHGLKHL